jgi:hypothetical protein
MAGKNPKIRLIDKVLAQFEVDPSGWLEQELLEVSAQDIREITLVEPDGETVRYTLVCPEKGKEFELLDKEAGQEIDPSALNRLKGALASLRLEDVADPANPPHSLSKGVSPRLDFHLFDGLIYRVYPGGACEDQGPCYLRIEVDSLEPGAGTEEATPDSSSAKDKSTQEEGGEERVLEAKKQSKRLSPWVYLIPKWKHSAFMTDLKQLLAKKEENADSPQK